MSVTSNPVACAAAERLTSTVEPVDSAAVGRTATVRVPASTSNLGSGFDCVGLAVDRWLVATATVDMHSGTRSRLIRDGATPSLAIQRGGTLHDLSVEPADDLIYAGFRRACEIADARCNGIITFTVTSDIPVGRGLGSSAAAIVAGAMLANEALSLGLTEEQLLVVAVEIEGHSDNVAACLHGGAVLTIPTASGYVATPLTVASCLSFIIVVPAFGCNTRASRLRLPESVPYADAVLAVGRSAALVKGLETGDARLLAVALDDVLHVPYRGRSIAGFDAVRRAALDAGAFGATLSGSGSAILAIATADAAVKAGDAMVDAWKYDGVEAVAIITCEPAGPSTIIQQENQ